MSTRSFICKENIDHTYTGIYCHNDGYPEYNGQILVKHYSDRNKVNDLLRLGSLSVLAEEIAPPSGVKHTFDEPIDGVCVAYHRDRGDDYEAPSLVTLDDYKSSWCEYLYVFGLDNKWRYYGTITDETESPKEFTEEWAKDYYEQVSLNSQKCNIITIDDIIYGVPPQEGCDNNGEQHRCCSSCESKDTMVINLNININVTNQDIDEILSVALDGCTTYWCKRVEVVGDYLGEYASEQISLGGTLKFYDSETDEAYKLTKENFLNGLKIFLNTPTTFGRVVYFNGENKFCIECGEIDGADADDIVQYALFGEVVYG